ncbi:MAG: hypothetical protein KF878_08715 [Planctomycetes bacterium]|nr:hypothetical protein [Planctomycetota bacterium]
MRRALLVLALTLQGCGWYYLQPDPNLVPVAAPAPDFSLPAGTGVAPVVSLSDLRARGHVVLVFYRGHW